MAKYEGPWPGQIQRGRGQHPWSTEAKALKVGEIACWPVGDGQWEVKRVYNIASYLTKSNHPREWQAATKDGVAYIRRLK